MEDRYFIASALEDLGYRFLSKLARKETNGEHLKRFASKVEKEARKQNRTSILEQLWVAGYIYA